MKAAWFAGRLKELRQDAGLTQQQLADKAGMVVGVVRNLEQSLNFPTWETVLALAQALSVDCTAFTQPPAKQKPLRPGRPPKPKGDPKPATPKRLRRKPKGTE